MATIWTHVGTVHKGGKVTNLFLSAKGTLRLCSHGGVINNVSVAGDTRVYRLSYMKYVWFTMAGRMDLANEIFASQEDAETYLENKYA